MKLNQLTLNHGPFFAILAGLAMILAQLVPVSAEAGVVVYNLHNHPDGNEAPPLYGLRLDGLLTGNSDEEYTFDFDHADSAMKLTYDGSTIVIDGVAFGGEDDNTTPDPGAYVGGTTALWNIHFEYNVGLSQPGGEGGIDDIFVNAHHQNFGVLSSSFGVFELRDHANDSGLSFQFGDEGGAGHRGFDGLSGWGWLDHRPELNGLCVSSFDSYKDSCGDYWPEHIYASDWLFTATVVPVPAAVWLFGSGLIGLIGVARRRRNK